MPIKPMLCELKEEPWNADNMIWERKLDGLRILAEKRNGETRLFSRSGKDKTAMFPEIRIETAGNCDAILDGEIEAGTFNQLQHRFRESGIRDAAKQNPAAFHVFDIIEAKEFDLRTIILGKRKEVLPSILIPTDTVKIVSHVKDGVALYQMMDEAGAEGVVGKRLDSTYKEGSRTGGWYKAKCWKTGMFTVVGYTQGTGWRQDTFGSLVLADMEQKYVGAVGTGPVLTMENIKVMHASFSPAGACPWSREPEQAIWIKPFPVRVKYLEYTNDGKLRFPVLQEVISG